ncbi:GntR family transcriptional regulator [uncultured Metabacillus sp.]|uniref:GntR family transcriptional regulator n=1 Tax=uncultured Metabacillus sp. TaxID=2860135 RepID=UPI00261DA630|nr:GntR family transcriptional regulator [uncultured Metabacillus sp.]
MVLNDGRSGGSTSNYIYQTLKEQIINLTLEPGKKMSEKEIADQLKVSRTPVRESFLKLSQEELLEIYPQRGTFVSRIDLAHVEESRFVRENIEKAIVRLACEKLSEDELFQLEVNLTMQEACEKKANYMKLFELDDEFHKILYYACDKQRTWNMLQQMSSHFKRLRLLRLSSNPDWNIIISQHKQIFELVKNNEQDQVEKTMSEHLRLVVIEKELLKQRYPSYFK